MKKIDEEFLTIVGQSFTLEEWEGYRMMLRSEFWRRIQQADGDAMFRALWPFDFEEETAVDACGFWMNWSR